MLLFLIIKIILKKLCVRWTRCDRFIRINSTGWTLRTHNETYAYIEDKELFGQLSNVQRLKYGCALSIGALFQLQKSPIVLIQIGNL
jgi:hypothetical protein